MMEINNIEHEKIIIPNIENYIMEMIDGKLILIPKNEYVSEDDIFNINFINSKILECCIKKEEEIIINNEKKYFKILKNIWKSMPIEQILENTTFNVLLINENGTNGFNWFEDLNFSVQPKDANGTIKEIINMIKICKYTLNMCIKLESGKIINIIL